ncbi:MAG TPA: cupin domain-containing protein [Polyangiaceae bacterium]|jgi:uncharacterized cupin superfamily protein|nr:cupin domain-containing protein [Polyangiaceae bacterium]
MSKNHPILNIADVELKGSPVPLPPRLEKKYAGAKMGFIGSVVGAQKLGYNLTVVPPGKRAFPRHAHRVNEEMFFVVSGTGEVRIGDETFPIREGDVIANPPGGAESAHQIINTGTIELRYLAVSTKLSPEIVEYPDSKKFGVAAEIVGADGKKDLFRFIGRAGESVPYYDGEPED